LVLIVLYAYFEKFTRENTGCPVGPLDHTQAVSIQILFQPHTVQVGALLKTVEVRVVKRDPGGVLHYQYERRASYVVFRAQAPEDPLGETGLSRAQLADQENDVSGPGMFPNRFSDRLGSGGIERLQDQYGFG
jgi:hypothetical protein